MRSDHDVSVRFRIPLRVDDQVRRSATSELEVDHLPGQAVKRFLQCFRQCRVGVDIADQFLDGQIPALGQGELGQQLGDVGADQVRAEQLSVRAISDDFGESGGITVAVGFSVGAKGELGHRDVAASRSGIGAGLGLGQAETGDLGLAER